MPKGLRVLNKLVTHTEVCAWKMVYSLGQGLANISVKSFAGHTGCIITT